MGSAERDRASRRAARAIDAMLRGWPVGVGDLTVLPIESADAPTLAAFDRDGTADILISPARAATLKLANQRHAASGPVVIVRPFGLDLPLARALADPALDLAFPMKGPFATAAVADAPAAEAALTLARQAGLLPAFFVRAAHEDRKGGEGVEDGCEVAVRLTVGEALGYEPADALRLVTRARLPVAGAETCEIVAFRSAGRAAEHVALVIGKPTANPPLVRLHSECLTGDVFGSLKCDCGPQLHAAIARMASADWGILLYLRQEGRGIGLINKLRAYALQDQGFDTVDANLRLGFAVDARDFALAARMLSLLGVEAIRLLTNNPEKAASLTGHGITVVERVSHQLPANPYNLAYLTTKRDRTGHILAPEGLGPSGDPAGGTNPVGGTKGEGGAKDAAPAPFPCAQPGHKP